MVRYRYQWAESDRRKLRKLLLVLALLIPLNGYSGPVQSNMFSKGVTQLPPSVSDGSIIQILSDFFGRIFEFPYGPRNLITGFGQSVTSTTPVTFIGKTSSVFHDIMPGFYISNGSNVANSVTVFNGSTTFIYGLETTGLTGIDTYFTNPGWMFQTTANSDWVLTESGSATIFIGGYYTSNK